MHPMDSDESRDSSSASESESDGETRKNHRQRSLSGSASSRSRSNSSSSESDSGKRINKRQKSVSSGSRSSKSRSASVESKTTGSQNRRLSSKSRSASPDSPQKSPISRPTSIESKGRSLGSAPASPDSRPKTPESKPGSPSSIRSASNSPQARPKSPKSTSSLVSGHHEERQSSDRNGSPVIREGPPRSPSIESSVSSSSIVNHNNVGNCIESPQNGKSKSASPDRISEISEKSDSSRTSKIVHEAANLDDGNTSDSSESSGDMSRHRKTLKKNETRPEELSDDDSEVERKAREEKERERDAIQKESVANLQMAHEDLSDVSDLDNSVGAASDEETKKYLESETVVKDNTESENKKILENNARTDEGEEQLDFEAEDGECPEQDTTKDKEENQKSTTELPDKQEAGEIKEQETKEKEELEEGEVTDEDEVRPEETEPRPVCRFFSRGQCTWGASCRFLHPGVTDKGNYTMFELIRPVVPGDYGHERMLYGRPEPPPMESAWERGLRTAKEMLRKSIKRKEQDIDFEEKKMNLSLTQEELDKENGYYTRTASPEPRYAPTRHVVPVDYAPVARPPPEEYYGRRQVIYEPEYVPPPRERVRSYREVPVHRVPDYYNTKYEEDATSSSKPRRPKREVIVQRVEEERRPGRGDEWSDPWMRSKSPAGRKGRRRSYSSGSSYSSSSSSRSSSGSSRSSYRSRSRTPRRRRSSRSHKRQVSPSVIVSERKAANERAALMNPPAPRKKAPSPGMMRAGAQNPPAPSKVDQFGRTRSKLAVAAALARVKGRTRSSRSSSGSSSGSSSSDSDSSGSSSSSSRDRSPPRRPTGVDIAMALKAKAIDALKSGSEKRQIKLNLKSPASKKPDLSELARKAEVVQAKKRPANSPPAGDLKAANKKASSRREELLKQLKAVEDAIAKKRSKVN